MTSQIEKENVRCMNVYSLPMRLKGREPNQPLPDQDKMFKNPKIKNAGKKKPDKEKDIFDFPNMPKKKVKKIVKKTPQEKNLFDINEPVGNKKTPKLNKN